MAMVGMKRSVLLLAALPGMPGVAAGLPHYLRRPNRKLPRWKALGYESEADYRKRTPPKQGEPTEAPE